MDTDGITRIYSIIKRKNENNFENDRKKLLSNPVVKLERLDIDIENSDRNSESSHSDSSSINDVDDGRFMNCMYSGIWKPTETVKTIASPKTDKLSDESDTSVKLCDRVGTEKEIESSNIKINLDVKQIISNAFLEVYKEKDVILNTYKQIEENWPLKQYPRNKETLYKKTAEKLGIAVDYVKDTLEKTKSKSPKFLNELTENAIRKIIHRQYMNGELPTKETVLQIINDDRRLPNLNMATFNNLLNYLKMETVKKRSDYPLVDREEVMLDRVNYLKKIKEYRRQKRCIYYMDEMTLCAESVDKDKKAKSKYMIIVHIGNEVGFVKGCLGIFYTDIKNERKNMLDALQFEDWFVQTIPKLKKGSLVVMDDALYHSRVQDTTPTVQWVKKDIQEWMANKSIKYDEENMKFELLFKIKEFKDKNPLFFIDQIAKKSNIEILRIPSFHYELNPMNSIWSVIDAVVKKCKTRNIEILKNVVSDAENKLPVQRWREAVQTVVNLENNFYSKIDDVMDGAIDRYLESVVSDSQTSDESNAETL